MTCSLAKTATGASPMVFIEKDGFWHFDSVKPSSSVEFPLYLTTSKNVVGTYPLDLTLTYRDKFEQTHQEVRSIGLSVLPKTPSSLVNIESYQINPEPVCQGDIFDLKLTLKNFGDFEAQMVTVQLISPTLFATITPSTVSVGDLLPNSTSTINYRLMASPSAEAGVVHVFEIDIYYVDNLGVKQVTKNFLGIPLHGSIELIVYDVSFTPSPIYVNNEFTVSFTVLNRGTTPAMYTNVTILPEQPFQQTLESSLYMGEIDPNAPAPASLNVFVGKTKEGTYPLKILISYRDEYNRPHSLIHEIPVKVTFPPKTQETSQPTSPVLPILTYGLVFVGILVLAVLVVMFWKKRKTPSG